MLASTLLRTDSFELPSDSIFCLCIVPYMSVICRCVCVCLYVSVCVWVRVWPQSTIEHRSAAVSANDALNATSGASKCVMHRRLLPHAHVHAQVNTYMRV